jgi:hypothetical protein
MRMSVTLATLWTIVSLATLAAADEPLEIHGRIDEVTVYRGQALVTRLVEIPGPAGLREIVVGELPEHILPGSIYAESAGGVEVRSVRYRIRPVLQDVRGEVRKLDEAIRTVQDKIAAEATQQRVLAEQTAYLSKLEGFAAPTADVELTQGVLNADTLKALTTFVFDTRAAIAKREHELSIAQRELNEQLALLERERDVLTGGSAKSMREAVVFVNLKEGGGKLRFRYLVEGASWSPSYNVRSNEKREQVIVEYNAAIEQMSGEDWNDVEMILSTATPSLAAKAPVLEPLSIALSSRTDAPAQPQAAAASGNYFAAKKELDERRKRLEQDRGNARAAQEAAANQPASGLPRVAGVDRDLDFVLNGIASESQVLDLVNQEQIDRKGKSIRRDIADEVSVSYQLPARSSLPSRADRQLVQVASLPMKAEFYKVAIPVLTSHVYDEARVMNEGKLVLLAGPVAAYLAGQFVGNGELPTVSVGESFTLGFGIDSSLRASRTLAKKTESIQGGNRVVDFTYQLAIENFGSDPVAVRLLDRLPTATESEIKLTLIEPGKPLSSDTHFQQVDRKKGLLRWDVEVPAQSVGPKAFSLEYQLRLEYDKQLAITGLPGAKK